MKSSKKLARAFEIFNKIDRLMLINENDPEIDILLDSLVSKKRIKLKLVK